MCGARLQSPPPPKSREASPERPPMPVSGPSFLGLADEPDRDRDFHYLLEDAPRGHAFAYVLLLLIMGAAAFGAWHFRAALHPLRSSLSTSINDRLSLNGGRAAP